MKIKTKRGARRIRNQRVITRRFVTTDYTGCPYITAGKLYCVVGYSRAGNPMLRDDDDRCITVRNPLSVGSCAHLNGNDWRYATT